MNATYSKHNIIEWNVLKLTRPASRMKSASLKSKRFNLRAEEHLPFPMFYDRRGLPEFPLKSPNM